MKKLYKQITEDAAFPIAEDTMRLLINGFETLLDEGEILIKIHEDYRYSG
jgi:hypothetical protein